MKQSSTRTNEDNSIVDPGRIKKRKCTKFASRPARFLQKIRLDLPLQKSWPPPNPPDLCPQVLKVFRRRIQISPFYSVSNLARTRGCSRLSPPAKNMMGSLCSLKQARKRPIYIHQLQVSIRNISKTKEIDHVLGRFDTHIEFNGSRLTKGKALRLAMAGLTGPRASNKRTK
jgi:hypothetical protein